jgi:hypothetical protein
LPASDRREEIDRKFNKEIILGKSLSQRCNFHDAANHSHLALHLFEDFEIMSVFWDFVTHATTPPPPPPPHDLTESRTKKGKQFVVCNMILTYECNFGIQIARTSNLVQCATMQFPSSFPPNRHTVLLAHPSRLGFGVGCLSHCNMSI